MKRLVNARLVLILGWVILAASMPFVIYYGPVWTGWIRGGLNPPLRPYPTWYVYLWSLNYYNLPTRFLIAIYFFGLVVGTITTILPSQLVRQPLVWVCRIGAVGAFLPVFQYVIIHFPSALLVVKDGIGCPLCIIGSVLIGVSAWIRPIRPKISN